MILAMTPENMEILAVVHEAKLGPTENLVKSASLIFASSRYASGHGLERGNESLLGSDELLVWLYSNVHTAADQSGSTADSTPHGKGLRPDGGYVLEIKRVGGGGHAKP